jgi:hypothetical protein
MKNILSFITFAKKFSRFLKNKTEFQASNTFYAKAAEDFITF